MGLLQHNKRALIVLPSLFLYLLPLQLQSLSQESLQFFLFVSMLLFWQMEADNYFEDVVPQSNICATDIILITATTLQRPSIKRMLTYRAYTIDSKRGNY